MNVNQEDSMDLRETIQAAGCDCEIIRDGTFKLLEQCTRITSNESLTYLENEKYLSNLSNQQIACIICYPKIYKSLPKGILGIALSNNPKLDFYKLHDYMAAQRIKKATIIAPSARISNLAYIASFDVVIGENVEIEPFVVINEGSTILDNVHICAGTIIGGQSFTAVEDKSHITHLVKDDGSVLIKNGAEICCDCHVARGILKNDTTTIGSNTKLDAKVHIGHGTVIGDQTLIASGAHIAGNCIVGNDVWVGVNATVSNRINIGNGARISLGAVVVKNVPDGENVSGNFAIPHQKFLRNYAESIKDRRKVYK